MVYYSNTPVQPVFTQLAGQVLKKAPDDLKCAEQAWKVTLVGEGADDAGGVFDESIAQMCEVQWALLLMLLCIVLLMVAMYMTIFD